MENSSAEKTFRIFFICGRCTDCVQCIWEDLLKVIFTLESFWICSKQKSPSDGQSYTGDLLEVKVFYAEKAFSKFSIQIILYLCFFHAENAFSMCFTKMSPSYRLLYKEDLLEVNGTERCSGDLLHGEYLLEVFCIENISWRIQDTGGLLKVL